MTRFVFVTGGVVSSLGKGIASASLGAILEARGLTKHFAVGRSLIGRGGGVVRAVDDIAFTIEPGRTRDLTSVGLRPEAITRRRTSPAPGSGMEIGRAHV